MPRKSPTPRCPGTARPSRLAGPAQRRTAARSGAGPVFGIVTSPEDFERVRPWRVSSSPDHAGHLREAETLLRAALATGRPVRARMFHPADYADFCLLHGLDPADRASHTRYLVNPALRTQLLRYRGEAMAGDFAPRLVRARDNGLTLRHIDLLLGGALTGPAQAAPPQVREAYRRGADALRRVLTGAGDGFFRLACGVQAPGAPLTCEFDLLHEGGALVVNDEDLDLACAVLCAAGALGLSGRMVLQSHREPAAPRLPVARGWDCGGSGIVPLPQATRLDGVLVVPGFDLGAAR